MKLPLSSSLLVFRMAYLKMIAKAWEEEKNNVVNIDDNSKTPSASWSPKSEFVEELLNSDNLLNCKGFTDFLPKDERGKSLDLGWPVSVKMKKDNEGPHWAPEHKVVETIRGWVGPYDKFVIDIPKAPKLEQQGMALSSYYSMFPTLLGGGEYSFSSKKEADKEKNRGVKGGSTFSTAHRGGSDNSLGIGGPDNLLSFGACVVNIIATAWESPKNLKELLSDKHNPVKPGKTFGTEVFQFDNPWGFDIEFKEGEAEWEEGGWKTIPENVIWLNFPKPPPELPKRAVALAAYNNSGPAYPYTCI